MESSGSRERNAFLTAAGILVALALVAVAARGSTAAGEGGTRRPTDTLLDILLSFYIVALVAGGVLFVYLLALGRRTVSKPATGARDWRNWLGLLVLAGIALLVARGLPERRLPGRETPLPQAPGTGMPDELPPPGADVYEPEFAWVPVSVTLALIALAVTAWLWSGRARRRGRGEQRVEPLATDLAAALDLSLDDLRREPDPRRAVIAAYARLERVLAAHELPRRPAEAPLEYLGRMLDTLSVSPEAARRLTTLFERAKFSQHAVAPEMKQDAIAALERVRDDLLAAHAPAELARIARAPA